VSPAAHSSSSSDFARAITRKFDHGRFLIIAGNRQTLESQFAAAKREAAVWTYDDLVSKRSQGADKTAFETAIWFYPSGQNDDGTVAEALSGCADAIVLIPGPGADPATRRPQLVECFGRFGFAPDYECDLIDLDPGAVCLRRQPGKEAGELVAAAETAFARLTTQLGALQRALCGRNSELQAADLHIATVEEKLLKLKQYQRELKLLKEEKQALRKSAERKVGQILLAPYRLPQKLLRAIRKRVAGGNKSMRTRGSVSAYEKWLHKHRASPEQIEMMRKEWHQFTFQPLISILTPVFDTPVVWLREAVESVLRQAYENWELVLI
jgi:hypothetical protein